MKLTGFFIFAAGVVLNAFALFAGVIARDYNVRSLTEPHDFIIIGCTLVVCGTVFIVADVCLADLLAVVNGDEPASDVPGNAEEYCHCCDENT